MKNDNMNGIPFSKTFLELVEEQPAGELGEIFDLKQEVSLCYADRERVFKESFRFRATRRARLTACYLIDEKGELKREALLKLIGLGEKIPYIFYPDGTSDAKFMRRFWKLLKKLSQDASFAAQLKKFYAPVCHLAAEQLIRDSLLLPSSAPVRDAEVKRAALASCLSSLRQNVGSCFATAPAILVHEEQVAAYLNDLYELLTTGRLKRTIGGVELVVPLSPSWGADEIKRRSLLTDPHAQTDCALLKAWEFTIASFCDVKMDFSKWNLYASLGLHPEERGGIGERIHQELSEKLAEYNREIEKATMDYEIAFDQLRMAEVLLRQAGSEREASSRKAEYQARHYHMQACLEKRDTIYAKAQGLSQLLPFLLKQYEEKFVSYFQEAYDPEMRGYKAAPYEDSPAGFRLIYKRGRTDPSFWTWIHTPEQYIDSLVDFFRSTENEILAACKTTPEREEIVKITTSIIHHLRSQRFLEGAILRMAKAHEVPLVRDPLADLDKIEKKPWAYTSGGTMNTLLKSYFRREGMVSEEVKRMEGAVELGIFLVDAIKHLSAHLSDPFVKSPEKGVLMQSPTHAFILHPGSPLFKEGWQDEIYTYTWVRDKLLIPGREFYENIRLSLKQQQHLVDAFADLLPLDLAHLLRGRFSPSTIDATPFEFRCGMLDELGSIFSGQGRETPAFLADMIDSLLYESLPLTDGRRWKEKVRDLLGEDPETEKILDEATSYPAPFLGAREIQEAAKICYLLSQKSAFTTVDLHELVLERARALGLSPPAPFIFADTNWTDSFFALIVNPGSSELELWRVDPLGIKGEPMSSWNSHLQAKSRHPWIIYPRTFEYTI
ncbi:MAG: hypothetical protein HYX48_00345 [Chlamydiales bacterium]|nr:hypothetical protein [Chlamydiales bacterium]